MYWLYYKTRWAWGTQPRDKKDWYWHPIFKDKYGEALAEAKQYLEEVADDNNYSDKWRGIDWHLTLKNPPQEIIDKQIESLKRETSRNIQRNTDIQAEIKKIQENK